MPLREQIEAIASKGNDELSSADRAVFEELKRALNRGEVRAAEKNASGKWVVNSWVKQGLLLGFRIGSIVDMSAGGAFKFFDKDTYPARPTAIDDNVRIVPGVRRFAMALTSRRASFVCRRCLLTRGLTSTKER